MKKLAVGLLVIGLVGMCAGGLCAQDPGEPGIQSAPSKTKVELNLRIFEGLRYAGTAPTKVVTSSFLRFLNYTSLQSESDESVERQIRQVFNLKDAKLLSEANLELWKGPSNKAFHIFRLDSHEYLILVTAGRLPEPRQLHIEVLEEGAKAKASLLDMEFAIPGKNAAVFGFEDTEGKPYFLAFGLLSIATVVGPGGGGESAPPKLVKSVDPVYPEIARQSKVQGAVILEATTDIYGRVAAVKVLRSIPLLDQAAADAVKQWEYEPAIIDGEPKPVTFTVSVQFDLKNEKGTAGVMGGVVSGALGGVEGGVQGGVQGAVQGGVSGGVKGGVEGGVEIQTASDKDAIRFNVGEQPPRLVRSVEPVYPEIARQAQVEGVVILEATTDEDGNVAAIKILRSIPLLDQSACEAVRQWKYEPLIIEGKRRKAVFTVTVRFMLTSGDKEKDLERFAQGAVKAVGIIKPPKLLKIVEPIYPGDAKKPLIEGVVILSVKTDKTGHVQDVMVLRSVPLLNKAAIDAVRQWVYEPYLQDGKPTPVVFTVTVRFERK